MIGPNDGATEALEVDVAMAQALLEKGAYLLDVREIEEWQAGHAPDAHHVPLGSLMARVDELPGDRRIVVCCRSGHRSGIATRALVQQGISAVNLAGGMQAWEHAALPVVDANARPGLIA